VNLLLNKTAALLLLLVSSPLLFAQTHEKEVNESATAAGARPKIAVLDFRTFAKTEDLGKSAAKILRNRLAETGDFTFVDGETLNRVLKRIKISLSGALDQDEAKALGKVLGVKNIVSGSVVEAGGTYTLNIRFIDAKTGQVVSGKTITARNPDFCREIIAHSSNEGFFYKLGAKTPARPKLSEEISSTPVQPQAPAAQPPTPAIQAEPVKPPAKDKFDPAKEVTFEQMLENPDDPDLNYAYARTQVRKGDLKGAAGTLERMLMVNPGLHDIRLFYGLVLYRLDNLPEAQREFQAVRKSNAPAALRNEAAIFLKEIKKKQKPTSVSGGLTAGPEYDSNRNASPTSEKRLFLNTPLDLTGSSRKRDDASFLFLGSAEIRRIVNAQKKHDVFGAMSYYRANQNKVTEINLQALSFKLGGTYRASRTELIPTLIYDRVLLAREKFLVNTGAGLRLERKLNKVTDYSLEAKYLYQDHLSVPDITSNPERRGGFYAFSAGAGRVLTPVMKLNADINFSAKRAKKDYNSYNELAFGLRHSWLLGKGIFLLSSAYIGRDIYSEKDSVICPKKRRDTTFHGGVVGGLPLSSMHRKLAGLKDLTLTLTLEHFRSGSNIINYTYTNNKAALLLNYKWQLGL